MRERSRAARSGGLSGCSVQANAERMSAWVHPPILPFLNPEKGLPAARADGGQTRQETPATTFNLIHLPCGRLGP